MRMPEDKEDLVGKVCVCSVGRVAVITGTGFLNQVTDATDPRMCWVGLGLDGKGAWASTAPCVVAENGQEFHDKLKSRFGGKMSFNG